MIYAKIFHLQFLKHRHRALHFNRIFSMGDKKEIRIPLNVLRYIKPNTTTLVSALQSLIYEQKHKSITLRPQLPSSVSGKPVQPNILLGFSFQI